MDLEFIIQKSEFGVLLLGFEKLRLGLDNCGRTTKNDHCRIYSLWASLCVCVDHARHSDSHISQFTKEDRKTSLRRYYLCQFLHPRNLRLFTKMLDQTENDPRHHGIGDAQQVLRGRRDVPNLGVRPVSMTEPGFTHHGGVPAVASTAREGLEHVEVVTLVVSLPKALRT